MPGHPELQKTAALPMLGLDYTRRQADDHGAEAGRT